MKKLTLTLTFPLRTLLLSSLIALTACGGGGGGSDGGTGEVDNSPSIITGESTGVDDGSGSVGGALVVSGDDSFVPVSSAEEYGNFTLNATGAWVYDVETSSASVVALAEDETAIENISITTVGGLTQVISVTVVGVNDAPEIGTGDGIDAGTLAAVSTDPATGTLTIVDPDNGESSFVAQTNTAGTYGAFSITESGVWTYALTTVSSASIVQVASVLDVSVTAASDATETFPVVSADGTSHNVTIEVTGIIEEETPVEETPTVTISASITDTDSGDTGELRYKFDDGLTQGKFTVSVLYAEDESETVYISLFDSANSTNSLIADLQMDEGVFSLRGDSLSAPNFTPGDWVDVELTWNTSSDSQAGTYTVTIEGTSYGSFTSQNVTPGVEVTAVTVKISSEAGTSDEVLYVDNYTVYENEAGTGTPLIEDNFDERIIGEELDGEDGDNDDYNSSSFSAYVADYELGLGAQVGVEIDTPSGTPTDKLSYSNDPNEAPSTNFDLSYWYLSVPTANDDAGEPEDEKTSDTISLTDLNNGYVNSDYFYSAADGGMVFKCPIYGYKTSVNTSYTRVELRELVAKTDSGKSDLSNNWVFSSAPQSMQDGAGAVDGVMKATLAINHVTEIIETYTEDGNEKDSEYRVGRMVIGQIHAEHDEPIRLYYQKLPSHDKGSIYFAHDPESSGDEVWIDMVGEKGLDDSDSEPTDGIELDEKFSYEINVQGNVLTLSIMRDGEDTITKSINMIGSYDLTRDFMYFKAGVYMADKLAYDYAEYASDADLNDDRADEYGQVTFYALEITH